MNYEDWRNGIKEERKVRNYLHIDSPLDITDNKIFARVTDIISNISNHQFLPFIKRAETVIRYRSVKGGPAQRRQKTRPIMYASHIDSHIYSYYNYYLLNIYDDLLEKEGLSENVIAYRKIEIDSSGRGKSNINFAKEVFDHLKSRGGGVVVTQDIEGFFDNIDHSILKEKLCELIGQERLSPELFKVFKSLTSYRYIEHEDFHNRKFQKRLNKNRYTAYKALQPYLHENKKKKAIPQGSPISGMLANLSLLDFDRGIKSNFPDVFYRRYSDDLVFVCDPSQKDGLLAFIEAEISKAILTINATKSYISYFVREGDDLLCEGVTDGKGNAKGRGYVDYLGFEFDGRKVFLRKNTIKKLRRKELLRAENGVYNTVKQKRRRPKKAKTGSGNRYGNYLKKAAHIIQSQGVKQQVLRVSKHKNKVKHESVSRFKKI